MSEIVKWTLVAFCALNAVLIVLEVGKPRRPTTGGTAAIVVVINAAIIVAVLTYWGQP